MEALDTVLIVGDDSEPERRRRTVPIEAWWADAVRRELPKHKMDQKALAAAIGEFPATVTRALYPPDHPKWQPIADVVTAISDKLKIAYPFRIAETEPIAEGLAEHHRLLRRDANIVEITAGVAGTTKKSQTLPIVSEHANRTKSKARTPRKQQRARP